MADIYPLTSLSLPPYNGRSPESLVVLLHGYGADGKDLLDLGRYWHESLPSTAFIAPNAPFPSEFSSFGRQWFGLQSMDEGKLRQGVQFALPSLQKFLDDLLATHNLQDSDLALVGFSQGAMMALSALLTRNKSIAGVLGYSGAYIPDPHMQNPNAGDILLIHGDRDDVIAIEAQTQAAKALTLLGANVRTHVCRGLGHSIDMEGLALGGEFLASILNKNRL